MKIIFLLFVFILLWRLNSCFEIFNSELDNKKTIMQLHLESTIRQNKLQNYQIQKQFANSRLVKLLKALHINADPNYVFAKIFNLAAYEGLKITFFSPQKKSKQGELNHIYILLEANGRYTTIKKFLLHLQSMLEPIIISKLTLTKTKKNLIHIHGVICVLLV